MSKSPILVNRFNKMISFASVLNLIIRASANTVGELYRRNITISLANDLSLIFGRQTFGGASRFISIIVLAIVFNLCFGLFELITALAKKLHASFESSFCDFVLFKTCAPNAFLFVFFLA